MTMIGKELILSRENPHLALLDQIEVNKPQFLS